ncbi:MAG: long-chain acyl-CoA synthetase, partial [Streblomastix strix]
SHLREALRDRFVGLYQYGAAIGYYTGSMNNVTDDICALHPTFLIGVPRVFQKTYQKIHSQVEQLGWFKKTMFNIAYAAKFRNLKKGKQTPWADYLVFDQIKAKLGGKIRLCFNGSASLPAYISEFISTCLGIIISEGYGLTETGATGTCTQLIQFDLGNTGCPYFGVEIRLCSIPEMDYYITDKPYPRGEILVRGPQNFIGYFKDEESTKAAFDEDHFFRTGDVGMWVPGVYRNDDDPTSKIPLDSLKIIDRRKNIFKLSQGEFICAERIEDIFTEYNPYIKQIMVYGPSTASALVAFTVPDWDLMLDKEREGIQEDKVGEWGNGAVKLWWEQGKIELKQKEPKKEKKRQTQEKTEIEPTIPVENDNNKEQKNEKEDDEESIPKTSNTPNSTSALEGFQVPLPLRELLQNDEGVKLFLLRQLAKTADEHRDCVRRFEIPKGIVVFADEWTDQNGCMTPSYKKKRDIIRNKQKDEFLSELKKIEVLSVPVLPNPGNSTLGKK